MKERRPWFRASKNAWYVEVDGKQIRLATGEENRQAALDAFYKLMAGEKRQQPRGGILVVTVCDLFLDYSVKRHTPESYQHYKHFLAGILQGVRQAASVGIEAVSRHPLARWQDEVERRERLRRHFGQTCILVGRTGRVDRGEPH